MDDGELSAQKLGAFLPKCHAALHASSWLADLQMLRSTAALLLLASTAMAAEPITGQPTVIDGDTIQVQGRRINLYGIDAPDAGQTCEAPDGSSYRCDQAATAALRQQIGAGTVSCEPRDAEVKGRLTAVCRVGGTDLSAWMATRGHAVAVRQVSSAYVMQERKAWATRKGLWAGVFEEPANWRRHAQPRTKTLASAVAEN